MTLTTSLVQRLTRPPATEMNALISQTFSGIGMMTEDQWQMVQKVFDVYYMGAAEYEFGAFPQALRTMISNIDEYKKWTFVIEAKDIKPGYWRESPVQRLRRAEIEAAYKEGKKPKKKNMKKLLEKAGIYPVMDRTIYVFGKIGRKEETEQLIREVASEKMRVKNGACMAGALDPEPKTTYDDRFCGWFDLHNQIFWFTEQLMWENTAKLFLPPKEKEDEQAVPTPSVDVSASVQPANNT